MNSKGGEIMAEPKKEKSKVDYETDIVQGTIRVRFTFDTGESSSQLGQLNFPLGTDQRVIEETLRDLYSKVQRNKEKPTETGKKTLDW